MSMNQTLVAVLSHSLVNDTVKRHWRWYCKSGCPILGVGRENTDCWFSPVGQDGCVGRLNIGLESYAKGDNHLQRFLSLLKWFVLSAEFSIFNDICAIEYDGIFVRPLLPYPGGLCTTLAGQRSDVYHGTNYYHTPWQMDRETAKQIIECGERMLKAQLYELGFVDRFLGLMADLYEIKITPASTFSVNTLDKPEHMAAARKAIAEGVCYVHGCKTALQLEELTRGL